MIHTFKGESTTYIIAKEGKISCGEALDILDAGETVYLEDTPIHISLGKPTYVVGLREEITFGDFFSCEFFRAHCYFCPNEEISESIKEA